MKILLIVPPLAWQIKSGKFGNIWRIGGAMPAQGLCQIAALSRDHGYHTQILDCQILNLSLEEALEKTVSTQPAIIGISSSTVSIIAAGLFARKLKEILPSTTIIIGGPHVSALPEQTMEEFGGFDIGVIGEGEITFLETVKAISGQSDLSMVNGIVYRSESGIKRTGRRPFIKDLDSLPFPAWDMLPPLSIFYRTSAQRCIDFPVASIITSRGCPYSCTFCDKSIFGRTLRSHSVGYIIEMLKILKHTYHIRSLVFNDDLFTGNKDRLINICESMIENNLTFKWSCSSRIGQLDSETLKMMKRAGCWQIALGIESCDSGILKQMNKEVVLPEIPDYVNLIKRNQIRMKGLFLFGMPDETELSMTKTIECALRLDIDDVQFALFSPYPGSAMYDFVISKYGYKPEWDRMNTVSPSFIPKNLTRELLIKYQKKATRDFYLRLRPLCFQLSKFKKPRYAINALKEAFYFLLYILKK